MKASMDDVMRKFAQFLNASWNAVSGVAATLEQVESTELISDWVQANWELLVETSFREVAGFGKAYLEPYGEGADCNDASSRVWNPSALPTHRIVCQTKQDVSMNDLLTGRFVEATARPVVFDHFATKSDRGWHEQAPPFDCVLGYHDDQEVLIQLDQVSFLAEQIDESTP